MRRWAPRAGVSRASCSSRAWCWPAWAGHWASGSRMAPSGRSRASARRHAAARDDRRGRPGARPRPGGDRPERPAVRARAGAAPRADDGGGGAEGRQPRHRRLGAAADTARAGRRGSGARLRARGLERPAPAQLRVDGHAGSGLPAPRRDDRVDRAADRPLRRRGVQGVLPPSGRARARAPGRARGGLQLGPAVVELRREHELRHRGPHVCRRTRGPGRAITSSLRATCGRRARRSWPAAICRSRTARAHRWSS